MSHPHRQAVAASYADLRPSRATFLAHAVVAGVAAVAVLLFAVAGLGAFVAVPAAVGAWCVRALVALRAESLALFAVDDDVEHARMNGLPVCPTHVSH